MGARANLVLLASVAFFACRSPRAGGDAHDSGVVSIATGHASRFRRTDELVRDPELRARIDALAEQHEVDSEAVGDGGDKSPIYALYRRAAEIASPADATALLRHESPVVRLYFAHRALEATPPTFEALYPLLSDTTPVNTLNGCIGSEGEVGAEVIRAMAWRPVEGTAALYARAAKDPALPAATRTTALHELAYEGDESARPIALSFLDAKAPLDEAGLRALGSVGEPGDAPRVIPFSHATNADTRSAAARALGRTTGPEAAAALVPLLADPESDVRRAAAKSYAMQPTLDAKRLGQLVNDPDRLVRDDAIEGLAARGGDDAIEVLLPILMTSDPPNDALDELFHETCAPATSLARKLLTAKDSRVRSAAIHYLGKAKDTASARAIEGRLAPSADVLERMEAAETLALLGDAGAVPGLVAMLKDDNPNARITAANALVALHARSSEPALRRAAEKDTSWGKKGLLEALAKLKSS